MRSAVRVTGQIFTLDLTQVVVYRAAIDDGCPERGEVLDG